MSKFNDLYNLIMEEILNESVLITEATEQITNAVRFLYTCQQTRDLIEAALDNINDNILKPPFYKIISFQYVEQGKFVTRKNRLRNDNCNIYLTLYRHAIYGYLARVCLSDILPLLNIHRDVLNNHLLSTSVTLSHPLEDKEDKENYPSKYLDFVKYENDEFIHDESLLKKIQEELNNYTNYCLRLRKVLNKIVTSKDYGFKINTELGLKGRTGYKCLDTVNKIIIGFDIDKVDAKNYNLMITNTYPQLYDDGTELAGKKYVMIKFEQTLEPKVKQPPKKQQENTQN